MIKYKSTLLLLTITIFVLTLVSCSSGRQKDPDEIVLHEMIQEKNGVYYWGDCEEHADTKYTGTDTCYQDNGKVKATYTIKNGLPNGHWKQFDTTGKLLRELYFDNGTLKLKSIGD
jgi:antitoxin component YwqK of YwqJK toxin-antitoxin module